jgi:pimeloyl-ACP methyl ester carboxylesterase
MKLELHTAGNGERTALLIHGLIADHGTWHAVEAELVSRGYRVLAPDLRGHGRSPRAGSYRPEDFADDLAETLPAGADVAIGHSLGGLTLSLAAGRLRPARAVLYDPALTLPKLPPEAPSWLADALASATADTIRTLNPRWSDADIAAELASIALFDPAVAQILADLGGQSFLPDAPAVPTLVQLADPSAVVPPEAAATLRGRGFEVVTVQGAGHCIHRDDLPAFLASLDGWI